jgi:hypothetical protein
MSDTQDFDSKPSTLLVLQIENRRPVPLGLLAGLFDAMARDYKQTSGRELVIWEVHRGSIWAYFSEMSQMADSANHLIDFAKHVGGLAFAAMGGAAYLLHSKRTKGAKTVLALAKIAMKGDAGVRLSYRRYGEEEVTMAITPAQAENLHRPTREIRHEPPAPTFEEHGDTSDDQDEEPAKAIKERRPSPVPGSGASMALTPPLVHELVEALRHQPSGPEILAEMARRHRDLGREATARMLER